MTPELRHLTVDGARLGYEVHSEGSRKPPAIFVHGYSARSTGGRVYADLLRALAEEFTVVALDLRGHGASATETDNWSMSAVADDVAAVVQRLGLVEPLYIGHSIGGFTGMFCEVRHPGTFSAMCLLTPAAAGGGAHTPPEIGRTMIQHAGDADFLKAAFAPMYVRGHDTSVAAEAAALVDARVHQAFYAEYPSRVIIDEVGAIAIPVLILNGGRDNVVPLSEQHRTALALPNSKEVIFMSEGHMLPLELPDAAAREIIAFWRHDVGRTVQRAPLHLQA